MSDEKPISVLEKLENELKFDLTYDVISDYGPEETTYLLNNGYKASGVSTRLKKTESGIEREEFFRLLNNGYEYTGSPIWYNHYDDDKVTKKQIGVIESFVVASDNDLFVTIKIGPNIDNFNEIVKYIKLGLLNELSIHYSRDIDHKTGTFVPDSLKIIETSLTPKGAIDGTTLRVKQSARKKK